MAAALNLASLGTAGEIRGLLENSRRFPPHAASSLATATLLKRWLELEPAAALEYCRLHENDHMAKLIGTWSTTQPAAAEAYILNLPAGEVKINAWKELCAATAVRDPDKAWELLARTPARAGYSSGYELSLVEKLTANNLEGTLARMATLPSSLLAAARTAVARQLMETDPHRAWDWVRQQPKPDELIGAAIGQALSQDPAQALAFLSTLSPEERKRVQDDYGYNWGSKDTAALAAVLGNTSGFTPEEKETFAQRFFSNAAWQDPEGAQALLPLLSEKELPANLDRYLKSRSTKDRAAAEAWITGLPAGSLRAAAEASWQKLQLPETPVDRTTVNSLISDFKKASYFLDGDPRLALLDATSFASLMAARSGTNSYRYDRILVGLAKENPAPAAAWLATVGIDKTTPAAATVPIDKTTGPQAAKFSAAWAQEDPSAAAAWVRGLPPGDLARTAAGNVARHYQRYAPAEAAAWANTLPPGPVQDAAREALKGQ